MLELSTKVFIHWTRFVQGIMQENCRFVDRDMRRTSPDFEEVRAKRKEIMLHHRTSLLDERWNHFGSSSHHEDVQKQKGVDDPYNLMRKIAWLNETGFADEIE